MIVLKFKFNSRRIYIKKKPVYHPPAYKPAEPYKPSYGHESSSYSGGSGGEYAKGK